MQVTSVEDAIDELNENLNVEGTVTSGNTSNASDFGIVTITDDDNAPIFSIANASANEGTNVIFIATLSNPSYLPTTILVSTTLNTAGVYPASNSDFTTVITTITIPAGQLTATVSVATINDSTDEPDETFLLNGTVTSENTNNVNDSAVGTIIDIDGVPTFSIDDVTIIEGNVAIVTVSISNLSSVDTVINITTSNGSAIAPDDYTPLTTIVIIPAGQTTTTVSIPTANDLIDEPTEAFTVNGNVTSSNTSNSNDTGIVTITDNNPLPTFTISDVTVIEGDLATVTISLTNPSYLDTVIDILTTEVSATSAEDYIEVTTTITIPAGQTTTTILITTVEDGINEPSEILNVNGTSTSGNTANNNDSGTVTITDDDPKPIFTVSDVTVEEGDIANVIVSLSGQSSVDTVIAIVTTNVTATSLEDYTSVTTTITIPTGQLTASISIQTASDNIDEQNETFSVDGTSTSGNTSNTNDSGTVTIIDDPADTATFNVEDVTVVEGITAFVNVTLSNPSSVDTVLNIVSSNGTATAIFDYTPVTIQVTIPAGQTSVTVDVQTIVDQMYEIDETLIITGTLVTGTTSNTSDTGTVTITNDDPLPILTISNESETEGTPLVFTITLSNPSSVDTVVILSTNEGTALSPEDYTSISTFSVTIPSGQTTLTVNPITSVDDLINEDDENFTLNGIITSNNTFNQTATGIGTIVDGDPIPTFTISSPTVLEGGMLNFIISLSNPTITDVIINVVTNPLTATSGADYFLVSTQVIIPAGQTSVSIAVETLVDNINEPSETLTLNGNAVSTNTANSTAQGIGTIDNNNVTGPLPTVTISNETETEGTSLVFTVTLSNPSYIDTIVDLNSADITATSTDDYAALSTITITIPEGQTSVTISPITTVDDLLNEEDEIFNLNGTVTSTNTSNTNPVGIGTITDNDAAIIATNDPYTVECSKFELLGNILSNDIVNGTIATTSTIGGLTPNVALTILSGLTPFINIDTLGTISVQDGIPFGTYPIDYQICELGNLLNCVTATITIVVADTVNPVVLNVPEPLSYQCIDEVQAAGDLTALDNCAGLLTVTGVDVTDNTNPCNIVITRTWTFNDGTNTATGTQIITVQDTTTPVFVGNLPDDRTFECSDAIPVATVQASDNCSTTLIDATFTDSALLPDTSGDCSIKGIINRIWRATDVCGNFVEYTQTFTIRDTTKPTVDTTFQPTIEATCNAIPNDAPTFADNCTATTDLIITGPTEITSDISPDGKYIITRTWVVSDGCNEETFTQVINVTITNYFQEMNLDADCNDNIDGEDIDLTKVIEDEFGSFTAGGQWSSEDSVELGDAFDPINGIFNPYQVNVGYYKIIYEVNDPNCPQTIEITLRVDDDCIPGACETLTVNNAISANNDGDNEFLTIDDITDECYIDNTVEIYNRWGVLVFETQNYDNANNVFKGESGGRVTIKKSEELPIGTYFYIITYRSPTGQTGSKQGYLYLTR